MAKDRRWSVTRHRASRPQIILRTSIRCKLDTDRRALMSRYKGDNENKMSLYIVIVEKWPTVIYCRPWRPRRLETGDQGTSSNACRFFLRLSVCSFGRRPRFSNSRYCYWSRVIWQTARRQQRKLTDTRSNERMNTLINFEERAYFPVVMNGKCCFQSPSLLSLLVEPSINVR